MKRWLSRALAPFAKVEPSEVVTVLVLASTIFVLLTGYYLLKTAREPLILIGGGAEVKSYAAAGQALLLLFFVRAYGSVAQRFGRLQLVTSVYLFFAANLVVFAAFTASGRAIGVPFYLWVGVFNYTSIAQFWAFAADVYTPDQGKRLFAILGIGGALGAVVGARVARALVGFGPATLMLVAAALLFVCVGLLTWADARARRESTHVVAAAKEERLTEHSAFALLLRDKFLLLIAALTLLLNWVNSNGEYILDRTLLETVGRGPEAATLIARFKADYFAWTNALGMVLQLFFVSRVLTRLGVRAALFFLPVVALGAYGLLFAGPALALIRLVKVAENGLDYSVQNTARQALYLVATRAEKFVGKTAVDTFFVRFGDVLSALLVWIGVRLALSTAAFAAANVVLVVLWLSVVIALGREHRRRSNEAQEPPAPKRNAPVMKRVLGLAVFVAALVGGGHASAATPKRDLPSYDGRSAEPTTPDDVAMWVARIALAPLYFVAEYVIRRPLGAMIAGAERAHLPEALYNFFFFGPDHKAGFAPIAFVDFGFNPSVGVYTFWDDAFFKGNDLRFHGSTWGEQWIAGVVTERMHFGDDDALTLSFSGVRRPDHAFFGLGPDTRQSNISRFREQRIEASAGLEFPLWRSSRVETVLGIRSVDLENGHYGSDPSLGEAASRGTFATPYGFDRGYTAQTSHILAALDTRRPRPASGSGVRIEVEAEEGADVRRSPGSAWLRYGTTAGAFFDLNGRNRVISISATAELADPLGSRPIPFTELVALGGSGPMRGYYPGRLVDRSAAVVTAHYRWPIWVWLDGSLQVATGNVFGEHLEDFKASRLRLSGAVGVESVGSRDGSFELLVGVGTETFDQGAKVDSVRIALGANRGF